MGSGRRERHTQDQDRNPLLLCLDESFFRGYPVSQRQKKMYLRNVKTPGMGHHTAVDKMPSPKPLLDGMKFLSDLATMGIHCREGALE